MSRYLVDVSSYALFMLVLVGNQAVKYATPSVLSHLGQGDRASSMYIKKTTKTGFTAWPKG